MKSRKTDRGRARRFRRPKLLIAVAVSALVVAVPAAWASHDFADVPTGNPFHAAISAIKGAGITTGCGGGNYCPGDNVTREAMAAFMHRGFGRVAQTQTLSKSSITSSEGNATIASVTITVPGAAGTQFVRVDGSVNAYRFEGCADCNIGTGIDTVSGGSGGAGRAFYQLDNTGHVQDQIQVSRVFAAAPGTRTYYFTISTDTASTISLRSLTLIAQTMPFGSSGTSALGMEPAATTSGGGLNGN